MILSAVKEKMLGLLILMRPKQWIKNSFVFAPLVFTGQIFKLGAVFEASIATFLFCLASSASYIVNDIWDIEMDRSHPKKSKVRPLASGIISIHSALVLLVFIYVVLLNFYLILPSVVLVILAYLLLNIAYTFVLKNQPVLDIFTISIGFVLRIIAGSVAINVKPSAWMCITTLCLALFLAAVKRRQELAQVGFNSRYVLRKYSVSLVDRYAEISAAGALLFYSMFVMSVRPELVITIPLVIYGLFRYWYVVEVFDDGESPTDALLADWQLMSVVSLWVIACVYALSGYDL